ncbi:MAG: hypothetical protein IPL99_11540 [Candidatus Competibacteraceae bacterium]|nr:hypothetical protein [Candidatus Competibacteraceae bacterium]
MGILISSITNDGSRVRYCARAEKLALVSRLQCLVKGIGIVNLVHAHQGDYHPVDFRVYAPMLTVKQRMTIFGIWFVKPLKIKGLKPTLFPPVNFPVIGTVGQTGKINITY